jgi:hypothetical protein
MSIIPLWLSIMSVWNFPKASLPSYFRDFVWHKWWSIGHPANNFVSTGDHDLFKNGLFRILYEIMIALWNKSCRGGGPCFTNCVIILDGRPYLDRGFCAPCLTQRGGPQIGVLAVQLIAHHVQSTLKKFYLRIKVGYFVLVFLNLPVWRTPGS